MASIEAIIRLKRATKGLQSEHPHHSLMDVIDTASKRKKADPDAFNLQPPEPINHNYSWFRRTYFDGLYSASLALAVVAGIEGAVCTILFRSWRIQYSNVGDNFPVEKTPFLIVSALASFLVVFRTQICHNRWWEGRSHMGTINKALKALLIQTSARDETDKKRHEIARLIFVCFTLIVLHLWRVNDLHHIKGILTDIEMQTLAPIDGSTSPNRPLLLISWISKAMTAKSDNGEVECSADRIAMWAAIDDLIGGLNGADKVARTPIPRPYHVATRFVLYFFCFSVPICIASYHHMFENIAISIITSSCITFLFFLLSFVSEDLENPFVGNLALPLNRMVIYMFSDVSDIVPGWDAELAATCTALSGSEAVVQSSVEAI